MKREVSLSLVLVLGMALPVNTRAETVDFGGRVCEGCKVSYRQGYLKEVIHPTEGTWAIDDEFTVFIDGKLVEIDPLLREAKAKKEAQAAFERIDSTIPDSVEVRNTESQHVFSIGDVYTGIKDFIDYFPALNLFLIVATSLMLAYALPPIIQRWKK